MGISYIHRESEFANGGIDTVVSNGCSLMGEETFYIRLTCHHHRDLREVRG